MYTWKKYELLTFTFKSQRIGSRSGQPKYYMDTIMMLKQAICCWSL